MGWGEDGGLSESVKKENSWPKSLIFNVEWISKNLWKMIAADVQANIKQQEVKVLLTVSYNFL